MPKKTKEPDPFTGDRPMTRAEIAQHATLVIDNILAEGHHGKGTGHGIMDNVHIQAFRLRGMIELAMCRAAAVEWGPVTRIKKGKVAK